MFDTDLSYSYKQGIIKIVVLISECYLDMQQSILLITK